MTSTHPTPLRRLCIIRLSAIGDVCNAQAAVLAIARQRPDCAITWVVGKTEAGLVADTPGLEFITFDKSLGWRAYARVRKALAGRSFDAVLLMHASMRANLLGTLVDAKRRIGFDRRRARDFQWLFSNERIARRDRQHVLDGFLQFAEHLGVTRPVPQWALNIPDKDARFARETIGDAKRSIVISPCSSQRIRNFRNWSAKNYAEIADYAASRYGACIVLTGGTTALERDYGAEICRLSTTQPVNLVGGTSLKQLAALIAQADAVVCPDSGPAHIATAVGTPVVGLYATSNPARTGPYLSRHLVADAYPSAVRQYFGREVDEVSWGRRVRDPAAMSLITADTVRERLDQALEESSAA